MTTVIKSGRQDRQVDADTSLPGLLEAREGPSSRLGDVVGSISRLLHAAGFETPALDARRLVTGVLGLPDVALFREPETVVMPAEQVLLTAALHRRLAHEPVSRILGRRAFHGLSLEIDPSTLDPRPETETLVDGALRLLTDDHRTEVRGLRVLDLGTGSGAIIIALLALLPNAIGVGVDVSEEALAVARRNALRHGLGDRVTFRKSDWVSGVSGLYDMVVSNPPYIPSAILADLEPGVRCYDPPKALDGGSDGLGAYRSIIPEMPRLLAPGGWLLFEVGQGQADAVRQILADEGGGLFAVSEIEVWPDLAGIGRCVAARALRRANQGGL